MRLMTQPLLGPAQFAAQGTEILAAHVPEFNPLKVLPDVLH
jgi:hypothetical protein